MLIFNIILFLLLIKNLEASKSMGPIGNIIIKSIFECPEAERPTTDVLKVTTDLKDTADGKSLYGTLTSTIPFDNNLNYLINIKKWENGSWKKLYDVKGKPCRDLPKYIPKIWNKLINAFQPFPGTTCPIKPGTYRVDKFTAEARDLVIPAIFYGKLQSKISAKDKNGQLVLCLMAEVESQAP